MALSDLAFLLTFLACVALVILILVSLATRKLQLAKKRLLLLASILGGYFAVLLAVSAVSPPKLIPESEDECFDDWCIAVSHAGFVAAERDSVLYKVDFRLSNHARGRSQRETGVSVFLIDSAGQYHPELPASGMQPPFDITIPLHSTVSTSRLFRLPPGVQPRAIKVSHGHGMGTVIIGDGDSLLHKPTVISLGES